MLFLIFLWAGLHCHGFVAFLLMFEIFDKPSELFQKKDPRNIALFVIWILMVLFA